jgi:hypothetical protein
MTFFVATTTTNKIEDFATPRDVTVTAAHDRASVPALDAATC